MVQPDRPIHNYYHHNRIPRAAASRVSSGALIFRQGNEEAATATFVPGSCSHRYSPPRSCLLLAYILPTSRGGRARRRPLGPRPASRRLRRQISAIMPRRHTDTYTVTARQGVVVDVVGDDKVCSSGSCSCVCCCCCSRGPNGPSSFSSWDFRGRTYDQC